MNTFTELAKILGPALIVLYAVYLMVRSFMSARLEEVKIETRHKNQEIVVPIRLQAYERITLLLERISPNHLVSRLSNAELTAREFQHIMIAEIRQEFNHNLSQQLYMSDEAWAYVSGAVEDTITMINEAGADMEEGSKSFELARVLFEKGMQRDSIHNALGYLKNEIREVF
ncbi:MAG: hypothetical protein OEY56_03045 [Cyclobacteriaceae bacterium]|nr:hypothetical protein [Cyclobacteriaceae bacterium]